jgi:vacuolar-type H+-ATPase subunit E/Vma4
MEKQQEPSDVLRKEILEQSKSEAEEILKQARKECERLLRQAKKEADEIQAKVLHDGQIQALGIEKKILSSVHLEIKKQHLKGREQTLNRVIQTVREKLEQFRQKPEYRHFLEESIIEAVLALSGDSILLRAGDIEKNLLKKGLLKETEQSIRNSAGRTVSLAVDPEPLREGGVLAVSADGRTRYDNSFEAQIKRQEDTIRLAILKDVFKDT